MRPERFVVTDQIWKFYFGLIITPDMHEIEKWLTFRGYQDCREKAHVN